MLNFLFASIIFDLNTEELESESDEQELSNMTFECPNCGYECKFADVLENEKCPECGIDMSVEDDEDDELSEVQVDIEETKESIDNLSERLSLIEKSIEKIVSIFNLKN